MTVMFKPIPMTEDFSLHVSVSIAGGSGTGKTYSACLLARGLTGGEPFAFIDTENKRALHYKSDFPEMQHYDFGPDVDGDMLGFPPERWIALLDQVQDTGVKAVVIDSFSHAWEGINGVLELQAEEVEQMADGDSKKAERVGQLAWAKIKPRYRRLIERIVQAKMDVIICIRAKPVMQTGYGNNQKNARPTKIRRDDLPWDIASDRDLIFEMTASMILEPERPGQPVLLKCPDHFRGLFTSADRINEAAGQKLREWAAEGGQDRAAKDLLDSAETEARKGQAAFQKFWKSLDKAQRQTVNTKRQTYIDLANAAEESTDGDIDFGSNTDQDAPAEEKKGDDKPTAPDLVALIKKELYACLDAKMIDEVAGTYDDQIENAPRKVANEIDALIAARRGEVG